MSWEQGRRNPRAAVEWRELRNYGGCSGCIDKVETSGVWSCRQGYITDGRMSGCSQWTGIEPDRKTGYDD